MHKKITIAIVTKKRPGKLDRCLKSILKQSVVPYKVLIVDNDKCSSAFSLYIKYKKILPLTYVKENRQGVPFTRNKALKLVKTPYLAFIDDDCVVDKNWVFVAEKVISKLPKTSYFIGNSIILNFHSPIALAQYVHQKYWFLQKLMIAKCSQFESRQPEKQVQSGCKTSPFNVDTKNIVFKVADLKKHKLSFDTNISIGWFDSADTDMGFHMEAKKMSGQFIKELKIWHEETASLKYFLQKGYYRGRLAFMIAKKWNIKDEFVHLPFLNLKEYLKSMKGWPEEYRQYFSVVKELDIGGSNLLSFFLIKLYERFFMRGYVEQAKIASSHSK